METQRYDIAFAGEAGDVLRAEFDDCEVSVSAGTTVLHADLPDPAALAALVQRLAALRLEVLHVRRVTPGRAEN
jgi:hypothetical protein